MLFFFIVQVHAIQKEIVRSDVYTGPAIQKFVFHLHWIQSKSLEITQS